MNNYNNSSFEKEYRRSMFRRKLFAGLTVILVFAVLGAVGWSLFQFNRKEPLVFPKYENLNEDSPAYWQERSQFNVDLIRNLQLPEAERTKRLRTLVQNDISAANKLGTPYDRSRAVMDIALVLAKNNADINIDSTVRGMEEKDSVYDVCGRIYVSQALMHLRQNNRTAAKTSITDYIRLLIANDLKLNSTLNEMSFCGAVTVFSVLGNMDVLNDLFQKHSSYALRIGDDKKMRAFRIIAGELARTGRSRQSVELLRSITDAVEFSRACQLIISFTARPPEMKPVEPESPSETLIRTEGPWLPLKNELVAKNIINEIVNYIADSESVDQQIDLLVRLTGSRLMCDPDIYKLFMEVIKENKQIEEMIKKPAVRLLENPQSETIRTALKMPPLPEKKRANIDTAKENWNASWGAYAGAADVLAPEIIKQISDMRLSRSLSRMAQGYLTASRIGDAVRVLQQAKDVSAGIADSSERIVRLLITAEQQIGAGDISSARNTLLEAGFPQTDSKNSQKAISETDYSEDGTVVYTEKRLSELARLQIIARFFDDALKTIQYIGLESARDDDYGFLVQELIQVGLEDEAAKITEKISDKTSKAEKEHVLAILKNGLKPAGKEHFAALKIFWTDNWEHLQQDEDLVKCAKQLIRKGLLRTAVSVVRYIDDSKIKSENAARIVAEYLQLWTAYSGDSEQHKNIRAELLKQSFEISESIPDILIRMQTLQKLIDTVRYEAEKISGLKEQLQKTVNGLLAASSPFMTLDCQKTGTPPDAKALILTGLLLQKIALERIIRNNSDKLPYVDVDLDKNLYTEVRKGVDIAVELLNASEITLSREIALSNLGLILLQLGRNQTAVQLLKEAEKDAGELTDKTEMVTAMLSIPPVLQLLGQNDAAREVFQQSIMTVSDAFVMKRNDLESVLYWRQRDVELDRIVRKMIQLDYIPDAVGFSAMISEHIIRDRLQRSMTYIYLDKRRFVEAEAVARRITADSIRRETIQDVLFMQRMAEQEQKQK